MVEETLRRSLLELQLVEVEAHFLGRTLDVLAVARGAIGLTLDGDDHVHVVDPEARLRRVALVPEALLHLQRGGMTFLERALARGRPLRVGIAVAFREAALVAVEEIDLIGNRTEDRVVHVIRTRTALVLRAAGEEVVIEANQFLLHRLVAPEARTFEGVHPDAHHGILHVLSAAIALVVVAVALVAGRTVALGACAQELLGHAAAHQRRVGVHRQILEAARLGRRTAGGHGRQRDGSSRPRNRLHRHL